MADTSSSHIAIQTLGDASVFSEGTLLSPPANLLRILVYILLEGRGRAVPRRVIGDLIWSDNGAEQASADIRQSLVRIRRFQEQHGVRLLSGDMLMLWLVQDNSVSIDLAEFIALMGKPLASAWVRMCELYRGDLLSSLRPAGEGFEEWLAHQRSVLRYNFVSSITRAVMPGSELNSNDRYFCASALLKVDPYHEGAERALMTSAAENGQLSYVRESFEEFARRLRDDLGVPPDQETISLYHRLVDRF